MGTEHKEYVWNLIAKKLAGEASPEELGELEVLLRNNPELYYPFQTVADLWLHSSPGDKKQVEDALNRHLDRMEQLNISLSPPPVDGPLPEKRSIFRSKAFYIAPVLAITIFLIGLFTWPHHTQALLTPPEEPAKVTGEVVTTTGSRKRLSLPDGTLVWLNAGSRINYDKSFTTGAREVSLTGEAFFDVAPNAERPFVIHTQSVDIRVLGTSFNIKSYPSDKTTEATLIKGSIEVSIRNRPSDKIILKPNEKLIVSNEDSFSLKKLPRRREPRPESLVISKPTYEEHSGAMIETGWVDNKLIFQDEEFRELARRMERWYGVSIRFDSRKAEELHFTGIFEKESIQQALDALRLTARFDYTIEDSAITIHN
jgi:transmembrane sensor